MTEEPYRILAIDGGGVRGVLSARLIEQLDAAVPFTAHVQLFAGTSSGALLALGLARDSTPARMRELFADHARDIFATGPLGKAGSLWGVAAPLYRNHALAAILREHHGDTTLAELPRKVLVVTFDLDNRDDPDKPAGEPRHWKPKFFHNYPGDDSDGKQKVVDVALRSAAAPVFFPSYQGYIDGGVVANNPSMAAVAQALDAGIELSRLRVLSIGAGEPTMYVEGEAEWGGLHWARKVIELMIDGVAGVADFQCRRLLGDAYRRVQIVMPSDVGLDAVDQVAALDRWAAATVDPADAAWLRDTFLP